MDVISEYFFKMMDQDLKLSSLLQTYKAMRRNYMQ